MHKLSEKGKKEWEIEGQRYWERENRSGWRWQRSDRVGLGVEWSGLVVGGGQIGDRWWRLVRWRAWWSTAYGWLSRSELVSAWLAIGKVDRWWMRGGLGSGWTGVCGSWVFGWCMIWAVGRRDRSLVGLAWAWLRWGVIWVLWVCSCSLSLWVL